ncbi:MAG: DUF4238 domain-containing protein [Methylocystis sp.]|uniref:DUF4238 domain-containing protein n=1 Tax=Methylocystis sp. TaxID=1911079 RepID=UPI003DA2458C
MANVPKGQHFIPRLHLQHFLGPKPEGQVWTFNKNTGASWSAAPENTAQQTHFYSAENEDGSYNTDIEIYLSEVESAAAPIYERLLTGQVPTGQDRADFAQFLALMYLRTPAMRRDFADLTGRMLHTLSYAWGVHEKAFDSLTRKIEREKGRQLHPDEKERMRQVLINPSTYTLLIRKEETLRALAGVDKLTPLISNMQWTLLSVTNGYLITCDNPLIRYVPYQKTHPVYGDGGFAHKEVEVSFPLSPKLMLLMTWQDRLPSFIEIGREHVERFNELRAFSALEFLYCHLNDSRIQKLANKFKGSRPRVKAHGFGPKTEGPIEVPRRWPKPKEPA